MLEARTYPLSEPLAMTYLPVRSRFMVRPQLLTRV